MKMGIERVLREKFGDRLLEVRELGNALSGGGPLTVAVSAVHPATESPCDYIPTAAELPFFFANHLPYGDCACRGMPMWVC